MYFHTSSKLPKLLILPLTLWLAMGTASAQENQGATAGIFFTQAQELVTGLTFFNGEFVTNHQLGTPNEGQGAGYSNFDINDPIEAQNALGAFASMDPSNPSYDELLARLNQAIDQGTIGREDVDNANLPNHDLYLGDIISLDNSGVPTREKIIEYLLWVANEWDESAWGYPLPHSTVTNLEQFSENLLAGSPYQTEETTPLEELNNYMMAFDGNINEGLIDLLLDMDHDMTFIGGWGSPDSPLIGLWKSGAVSQSPNKMAGISKAMRGPDKQSVWALYSGEHETGYEGDETQKIDWGGVDTAGLEFWYKNVSNSNISGAQISNASYISGIKANGVNLSGFSPVSKPIVDGEFNNATNVDVFEIVKSPNFANTSFVGALKPDGSLVTKADFVAAISTQFPGNTTKLNQLDTVLF